MKVVSLIKEDSQEFPKKLEVFKKGEASHLQTSAKEMQKVQLFHFLPFFLKKNHKKSHEAKQKHSDEANFVDLLLLLKKQT